MYCTFGHSLLCSVMIFSAIFYFCSLKTTFRAAVCQMEFFLSTHFPLQKGKKKKRFFASHMKIFYKFLFLIFINWSIWITQKSPNSGWINMQQILCSKVSIFNVNIRACRVLINRKYSYYTQVQNSFYETGLNQSQFFKEKWWGGTF